MFKSTPATIRKMFDGPSLQQRRDDAEQAVVAAITQFNQAALDALQAEGTAGANDAEQRVNTASAALEAARARVAALAGAADANATREASVAAKAVKDELAKRWRETNEHLKERARAAVDAERAINLLADAWRRLKQSSGDIVGACPAVLDLDGGLLRQKDIEEKLRLTMVKSNMRFAINWPWGLELIRPIGELIEAANAHILAARRP